MESFRKYLKRKGKKESVIERNIRTVQDFLKSSPQDNGAEVSRDDIQAYVESMEKEGKSAKGFLYTMMNYYRHIDDKEMYLYVAKLREERTRKSRRKFQIKDFLNVDEEVVKKLNSAGIKDVEQMLSHGKTREQRHQLAQELNVPEEAILELVNLSDITRMGYVKRKLSRLYYDSGFRSPIGIAKYSPEKLYDHFKTYIDKSGWDGMVPNLKDLKHNINSAKKLEEIIEY